MKHKLKFFGAFLGIFGFGLIISSLNKSLTGAIVGVTPSTRIIGVIGIILIILSTIIVRHELDSNKFK